VPQEVFSSLIFGLLDEFFAQCSLMQFCIFQPGMGLHLLDTLALAFVKLEQAAQKIDALLRQFSTLP
jgi:hypothetical protein